MALYAAIEPAIMRAAMATSSRTSFLPASSGARAKSCAQPGAGGHKASESESAISLNMGIVPVSKLSLEAADGNTPWLLTLEVRLCCY